MKKLMGAFLMLTWVDGAGRCGVREDVHMLLYEFLFFKSTNITYMIRLVVMLDQQTSCNAH